MRTASHIPVAELIVGESPAIRVLRSIIAKLGPSDIPVLIQGPTGSGKELVATALHVMSGRGGQFVAFDVCAISDAMFEDALFGHVKGAFTGAVNAAQGYLIEAHCGTLFLDEIAGLPLASQGKLMRALETGTFRPVGGSQNRSSDFRLIAAANQDVRRLSADGRFREDLAFRLRGAVVTVPPLRERPGDIQYLVRHFTRTLCHETGEPVSVTPQALITLERYTWPGNVRELKHVLACAARLADTPVLGRAEVEPLLGLDALLPLAFSCTSDGRERERLIDALQFAEWRTDQVAIALGISRATVYRRMAEYGIKPPRHRQNRCGLKGQSCEASGLNVPQARGNPHEFAADSHVAVRNP